MTTEKMPDVLSNLPKCECFSIDPRTTWLRCTGVARCCNDMVAAFNELANEQGLCKDALPYMMEVLLISLLTHIAKQQSPAVEYGSQEIEWEVERLLAGLELRVAARVREVYARAREAGLTEAKVAEMRANGEL